MTINGNKTYIGIGLWFVSVLLMKFVPEYADVAQTMADTGLALAGLGAAHKLAKAEIRSAPDNTVEETNDAA